MHIVETISKWGVKTIKVGDKIEVPSYLGGSFTAIITKVTPHGVQAKIVEGYGDFSGKINFYEFNEIERA